MATIGSVLALMHNWAGQPQPLRGSFRVEGPRGISRYRFWWLRPDRYRLEEMEGDQPRSITVRSDREVWSIRPRHVYHQRDAAGSLTVLDNLLMSPLGEMGGRPPVLKGTTTVAGHRAGVVLGGSLRHRYAEEIEAAVDLDAGVTLRRVRLRQGNPAVRMEIEEIDIDAELPAALLNIDLPNNVSVTELETKAGGFPLVEDLPRLLPFRVWVPNRPRDLQVVSLEADSSSVKLVWVENRGGERGLMVDADEGAAADEHELNGLERVDVDGLTVSLGIDKQKTPETWIVRFQKGDTPIRVGVRGSREEALQSALGLIPLSGERPELVDR